MKYLNKFLFAFSFLLLITACEVEEVENPNGPSLESLANGATQADLLLLATGLESVMRNDLEFYYNTVSIVGREYYDLNGTDPRYTGELLGAGAGDGVLDNNGFLTTRTFAAGYRTIRNAIILSQAVDNTSATLSPEEVNGYKAFSETVIAYELLKLLNKQYQNGVRIDVLDPDNLGPFVSYEEGLSNVAERLNNAIDLYANAGDVFNFNLSEGFNINGDAQINTGELSQFANALLARTELYRGNNTAAISALNNSFYDLNGSMDLGVYHVFGNSGNDVRNPVFFVAATSLYMAHNSFVDDAESGDNRLSKVADIGDVTVDDLTANYQAQIYSSAIEPLGIIRNEELILIAAEANIGTDNMATIEAINVIRSSAGLEAYSGDTDDASLLNEIAVQRRYSLFGEGHRWVDMRRWGRLGELPLDRPGDEVFEQFPTPVTEEE